MVVKKAKAGKSAVACKTPRLDLILEGFYSEDMVILEPRDRFDSCIIGVVERFGIPERVICYDRAKVIQLNIQDGMTEEEAEEFYEYNTIGAWMGEGTPVFIDLIN